ncbi:hypothetical protein ACRALDRAFT_2022889 [Sodiomyces alcalophilus JCM 7366]|uniref:uncharacterized protein n=1 Tax=Sodiomyces alcalophilus JCM 7366 TaxID=591952 RepID=UPI0039B49187
MIQFNSVTKLEESRGFLKSDFPVSTQYGKYLSTVDAAVHATLQPKALMLEPMIAETLDAAPKQKLSTTLYYSLLGKSSFRNNALYRGRDGFTPPQQAKSLVLATLMVDAQEKNAFDVEQDRVGTQRLTDLTPPPPILNTLNPHHGSTAQPFASVILSGFLLLFEASPYPNNGSVALGPVSIDVVNTSTRHLDPPSFYDIAYTITSPDWLTSRSRSRPSTCQPVVALSPRTSYCIPLAPHRQLSNHSATLSLAQPQTMSPASISPLLEDRADTQLSGQIQPPPSGSHPPGGVMSRVSSDATTSRVHPAREQPAVPVPGSDFISPHSQTPLLSDTTRHTLEHLSEAAFQRASGPAHQWTPSQGTTQDSNVTINSDAIFSPPASQKDTVADADSGHMSSQESQLFQLSQIAAAQDKMPYTDPFNSTVPSRKRMLNGAVKDRSSMSPVRGGHSRNTSTVSVASTTASTIGELSNDLKTRLSYAMVKLNNGWQSHSIDEVESLASHAASPTSSHSTLNGRQGSSASPRFTSAVRNGPLAATTTGSNVSPVTHDTFWRDNKGPSGGHGSASPPTPAHPSPGLASPAPIQPSRPTTAHNPRRNSNPRYTPTLLSLSHSASPHTPAQRSALTGAPNQQHPGPAPVPDPMIFPPHQNMREQDAIETLLFMSSPGNSANMKHSFAASPPVSAPASQQAHTGRHALPTSQPRKSLPDHRPQLSQKRVGFEKSPGGMTAASDMDVDGDSQSGTPRSVVRRRANGSYSGMSPYAPGIRLGHRMQLSLPAALGSSQLRPRPRLSDEDIERMLDRVAQRAEDDSSDDEEIQIPKRRVRAGTVGS